MAVAVTPESPSRARNPRGQGSRLRDEIVEAAWTLLANDQPVTLRSVAREAGIAAPSIYRHFPDVDALIATVAEQSFALLTETLTAELDAFGAEQRLRTICDRYLLFAEDRPAHYRLMFGGVWNAAEALAQRPTEGERLRMLGMDAYAMFTEAIERCVAEGVSTSSDPARDAAALWVALHGLAQQRQAAPLFPWPPALDETLVTTLARLSPGD